MKPCPLLEQSTARVVVEGGGGPSTARVIVGGGGGPSYVGGGGGPSYVDKSNWVYCKHGKCVLDAPGYVEGGDCVCQPYVDRSPWTQRHAGSLAMCVLVAGACLILAAYEWGQRREIAALNEWRAFMLKFDCRMTQTTWVKPGPTVYKCNDGIEYVRVE